jgi:hypothetical protein
VGPNRVHHLYLGDYVRAYPSVELCGAPGLPESGAILGSTTYSTRAATQNGTTKSVSTCFVWIDDIVLSKESS